MTLKNDELWAGLESDGEDTVRIKLAQGLYGQNKRPLVKEWLRQNELIRSEKKVSDFEQRAKEELRIASSARNAAWVAAIAAILSAIIAVVAVTYGGGK